MSQNGISTLATKEQRQIAKLNLAAAKRGESYDIDLLPTKYVDNTVVDNPNVGGLQPHRPWTSTPPITTQSWIFSSDDPQRVLGGSAGQWQYSDGSWITGSLFSGTAPAWNAYTYPDSSSGHTYDFTGNEWMISPNITSGIGTPSTDICVQMWVYPTRTFNCDVILLAETDANTPNTGYHYSMLEFYGDYSLVGRIWDGTNPYTPQSTAGYATANTWTHIYFSYNNTTHQVRVELNGGNNFTSTTSGARQAPGGIDRFAFGGNESSNMGAQNRFQGKLGRIEIYDKVVASNFNSQKTKYGL